MSDAPEEDLPIDRHHDFVSTVSLAGDRFRVGRPDMSVTNSPLSEFFSTSQMSQDKSPGSTHLPDLTSRRTFMASTSSTERCQRSTSSRFTTKRSPLARRQGKSWGVRIRQHNLPRQDPIPVRLSGRRHGAAQDDRIQVWVRVPKGKVAFWVPPNLPLGPTAAKVDQTCGRATPLRSLLTQKMSQEQERTMNSMSEKDHVQSTAKFSEFAISQTTQMSPCASSTFTLASDIESNFKSLIEAATGVPVAQQKLFFGPWGILEDNRKAVFQYEIGQGAMVHLSTRRDPELVAQFYQEAGRTKRPKGKAYHGLENPRHLLDQRIFDRIRTFMNTKVGSKMGKDLVMIVPDWKKLVSLRWSTSGLMSSLGTTTSYWLTMGSLTSPVESGRSSESCQDWLPRLPLRKSSRPMQCGCNALGSSVMRSERSEVEAVQCLEYWSHTLRCGGCSRLLIRPRPRRVESPIQQIQQEHFLGS